MMLTLFRSVAMEYKCQSELSYNIGRHIACDYAILPHAAGRDDLLWQQSLAFQQPMVLTTRQPLAGYRVENAQVSALRYDGDDVFLRIYNGTESQTTARITLPATVTAYAFTDGLMHPTQAPQRVSGRLEVPLKPFTVRGIRFFGS